MHVFAQLRPQIKDRVDHELPGAVIRDIAAAIGADDRNFLRRQKVRFQAAPAKRVNMGMLNEEENIVQGLKLFALDKLLLDFQSSEVLHWAEILIEQHGAIRF